jgi:plasmid stability protein
MTVSLTIKRVPERVLRRLRLRAAAAHRSLQGELLAIVEEAAKQPAIQQLQEPEASYAVKFLPRPVSGKRGKKAAKRLSLSELWARARRLGPPLKSESTSLIRALRDERNRR